MKRCFKCGRNKPKECFYRHPRMTDGLLGKCKTCTKRDVRSNRLNRLDKYRAYDRVRAKTEERKKASREHKKTPAGRLSKKASNRRWSLRNAFKIVAHSLVQTALKKGELVRLPCELCGKAKTHAHHEDYAKPLDVTWLCHHHHVQRHKETGPQ